MFLKQSTNTQYVLIGPFLDDTDGKTAETGLSIGVSDIRLGKAGGNIVAKNSGGATHDELGFYQITLDATDTATVGELLIAVHKSGALPVFKYCYVLEEAIYDAMFAASASAFDANARVDVASIEGSDATDQINAACDAALSDYDAPTKTEMDSAFTEIKGGSWSSSTDTLEALRNRGDAAWVTASPPAASAIADAVWDEATSGHTSSGSYGKAVSDILTDTAEIGSAGAGLTAVPWNSSWDAEVQSECNDALVALGLDHLVSASVAGSDVVDDSIIAKLVSKESTADWDDYVNTTESLQALRDRGDAAWTTGGGGSAPTAAAVADAVWDEAASGHASSGTFGKYLADVLADTAEIGSAGAGLTAVPWNSNWDAEVQSECTDALNAYDPPTKAEMDAMWTTAQTESYASDGAAATPAQLLYMILCSVSEFSISGTTITGKKLDGSTTAMTWTISDASNPTSRTRAS
jgi:hypothetical protein